MKTEEGTSGMLVTAVDVVDAATDNALLAPMVEQAEETTGTRVPMTLADAGYFAASHVAECVGEVSRWWCQRHGNGSSKTHITRTDSHTTSTATALRVHRDRRSSSPAYSMRRSPVATVPGFRRRLSGMPSLQSLYQGQGDWAELSDRTA